jgi:hypothetical protein
MDEYIVGMRKAVFHNNSLTLSDGIT